MKHTLLRFLIGVLSVAALFCFLSCGKTATSEQSTVVEIQSLPDSEGEQFYPFDEPPVLIEFKAPTYPKEAKQKDLEGNVMVKVTVGIDGTVEDVKVLNSSNPIFETPALEAAALCRFKPAKSGGQQTKSRVAIPYHFRLNV